MPDQMTRLTWRRRVAEDARMEWSEIRAWLWRQRWYRRCRGVLWGINLRLLAWMEDADTSDDPRLLAEDDNGDTLVRSGFDSHGEPYWEGYFMWWKPWHWPIYVRSRRARAYVMVEAMPR